MPFVTLMTNLSRSQLPPRLMPALCFKVAEVLGKDAEKVNWIMETDKHMSKGPDNQNQPFVLVEIKSIAVFDTKGNCEKFMPDIFKFLQDETKLKASDIIVNFVPIEPFRIGKDGKIMQ